MYFLFPCSVNKIIFITLFYSSGLQSWSLRSSFMHVLYVSLPQNTWFEWISEYQVSVEPQNLVKYRETTKTWRIVALNVCCSIGCFKLTEKNSCKCRQHDLHLLPLICSQVGEATGLEEKHRHSSSQWHFSACPWGSQGREDTQFLQQVLDLAQGLLPLGHARNTSKGRHPGAP